MKDTIYYHDDPTLSQLIGMVERNRDKDGNMHVAIWSRDCDGTERTIHKSVIATLDQLCHMIRLEQGEAEGPWEISFN